MDTIIAFFSIFGPVEIVTSFSVVLLTALITIFVMMYDEKSTGNKRKFYILYGVIATVFITYLIIAITCLHLSSSIFPPKSWFTKIPVKEQQMLSDYLQKNKYAAITIQQYAEIENTYNKYHKEEKFKEKIKNQEIEKIQYQKQHDGLYREKQLQALQKNHS